MIMMSRFNIEFIKIPKDFVTFHKVLKRGPFDLIQFGPFDLPGSRFLQVPESKSFHWATSFSRWIFKPEGA